MISQQPHQIPLGVGLRDDATFGNFLAHHNLQAKQAVEAMVEGLPGFSEQYICLWGAPGSGCTHLLQAACHAMTVRGRQVFYLPLDELVDHGPDILDGLEVLDLVCIDHIQQIAGDPVWEQALFHLFNRLRDAGVNLLVSADRPPRQLPLKLADLSSRLSWGLIFQIHALDDEAKLSALRLRALGRGFHLPAEVAQYILHRSPRDMGRLFSILDQLDTASLTAKRKVTIPFVKETLGW